MVCIDSELASSSLSFNTCFCKNIFNNTQNNVLLRGYRNCHKSHDRLTADFLLFLALAKQLEEFLVGVSEFLETKT